MKNEQKALAAAFDRERIAVPTDGPILAYGLTPGDKPLDRLPQTQSLLLEDFEPEASRLAATGWNVQTLPSSSEELRQNLIDLHGALARLALVIPGKQRQRALGDLALMAESLAEGGILALAVANESGSGRAHRDLVALFGAAGQLSKHKSRVSWAQKGPDFNAALAASWIASARARPLPLRREAPAVLTAPGLFAWDRLDIGSVLLATHLPMVLRGNLADFGCGWGYLSVELLARCPGLIRLDAIDADARAVGLARQNLSDPRVCVSWADASQPGEKARWDGIVTNPPFHQGRRADPNLGRAFIRAAAHGLKPGGSLLLVANITLPYEVELQQNFTSWRSVAEAQGYKLLMAAR